MTERMWRVVAVYRVITMIYAATLIIRDHDQYAHPAGGIAVLAVIIFWTSVTVVAYARPGGRQRWLIVADVLVTAGLVYCTRWVDTGVRITHGFPTLPSFWAASPVLACAVAFGPWAGMSAALVIAGADYAERPQFSLENPFSNVVLLLIAGGIGGYIVRLGVEAEQAVARVSRKEAAIAERERLARDIHDSVLQVLTRVSSRGRALGGEAAELGRLAAEQESALRRLITGTAPGPADPVTNGGFTGEIKPATATGAAIQAVSTAAEAGLEAVTAEATAATTATTATEATTATTATTAAVAIGRAPGAGRRIGGLRRAGLGGGGFGRLAEAADRREPAPAGPENAPGQLTDLRILIERFADPEVTVSCPASAVPLSAPAAAALNGATAAALDNVRQHAGPNAHAWVLVEDAGQTVRVSIRDDGTGFADGRLAEATAAGRLGVSHSIVGRLREVGGTAWVTSAPGQGTEVELAVPRIRPPGPRTGSSGPRPHRGRPSDLA